VPRPVTALPSVRWTAPEEVPVRIVRGCLSAAAIVPLVRLTLLPVWRDDALCRFITHRVVLDLRL
jgi:hypothetical protein